MKLQKKLSIIFLSYFAVIFLFIIFILIGLIIEPWTMIKKDSDPATILKLAAESTKIVEEKIQIKDNILDFITKNNGWLQILDENGTVIYKHNVPSLIQEKYAPGELLSIRLSPQKFGYQIYTWYKGDTSPNNFTWIYAVPLEQTIRADMLNDYQKFGVIMTLIFLFTLSSAFYFGVKIGRPLLFALSWIENLSKGIYRKPQVDSMNNNTFNEIIFSLETLSENLKELDEKKKRLDQTREEWIAGISHDMKTPLSSVKGYSELLFAPHYDFSKEQTREYALNINKKATYMQELIEDLNLTFQLSNDGIFLQVEPYDLVELSRRAIIEVMDCKIGQCVDIRLENLDNDKILYPIDKRWLQRALCNLIINAVIHNKEGTQINISILKK